MKGKVRNGRSSPPRILARSIVSICFFLVLAIPAASVDQKAIQIKKQPELQQIKPKKPVKVKLKRSAEGAYSWELSGDDVDDIVKADRRLRKLLGSE